MMSVSVNASPELRVGKPALLFSGSYSFNIIPNRDYDVGRDGRFIMVQPDSTVNSRQINVVFNWSNELGRQAPPVIRTNRAQLSRLRPAADLYSVRACFPFSNRAPESRTILSKIHRSGLRYFAFRF